MIISELPLDLFRALFEECILQWGVWHAVRYRLVNRLFDREIRHAICATRYFERWPSKRNHHHFLSLINIELRQQYLEYVVGAKDLANVKLAMAIKDVLSVLRTTDQSEEPQRTTKRLKLLCAAGVGGASSSLYCWLETSTSSDLPLAQEMTRRALVASIICGELLEHMKLLDEIENLSSRDYFFGSPLACAAATGSMESLEALLAKGARDSPESYSAICIAASCGHDSMVSRLLDIHQEDGLYNTNSYATYRALYSSISGRHAATTQLILNAPLVALSEKKMDKLMFMAAELGSTDIVQLFLSSRASGRALPPPSDSRVSLYAWGLCRSANVTKVLLDTLDFPNASIIEALRFAASTGRLENFRTLCTHFGRRSSPQWKHVLCAAAGNGQFEIARFILDNCALQIRHISLAATAAAEYGFDSMLRVLWQHIIEHGTEKDLEDTLRESLCDAVLFGHINVITTLLDLSTARFSSFRLMQIFRGLTEDYERRCGRGSMDNYARTCRNWCPWLDSKLDPSSVIRNLSTWSKQRVEHPASS